MLVAKYPCAVRGGQRLAVEDGFGWSDLTINTHVVAATTARTRGARRARGAWLGSLDPRLKCGETLAPPPVMTALHSRLFLLGCPCPSPLPCSRRTFRLSNRRRTNEIEQLRRSEEMTACLDQS